MHKINSLLFGVTFLTSFLSNLTIGLNIQQPSPSAIAQTNNPKMQPLEVMDENTKFTLLAPQGAKVMKGSWGNIKIQAGNKFEIELSISDESIFNRNSVAELKKEVRANDVNVLKRVLIETPTSILYESNVISTSPEFHLYVYKELDKTRLICENSKSQIFSQSEAELMWKSCNSVAKKS